MDFPHVIRAPHELLPDLNFEVPASLCAQEKKKKYRAQANLSIREVKLQFNHRR